MSSKQIFVSHSIYDVLAFAKASKLPHSHCGRNVYRSSRKVMIATIMKAENLDHFRILGMTARTKSHMYPKAVVLQG